MSVVIMTRFGVDAAVLEDMAKAEYGDTLRRLAEVGKANGALHHEFLKDGDGSLIALDEWESEDDYRRFFESQDEIRNLMAEAHMTGQPVSTTYRMVEAPDRF